VGETRETVNIIGISDTFIFELLDVIVALGMQPRLVAMNQLHASSPAVEAGDFPSTEFSSLNPESLLITGADLLPQLDSQPFPIQVLDSLRSLIALQEERGLTNWVNLIHPMAWISPTVSLGKDVYVGANSSIGASSSVESHVRINRNVSIGHNVSVGTGTEIAPCSAISSGSVVGRWCYLGAGSIVLNNVTIGDNAVVGAGSVVTRNVPPGATVVGSPARIKDLPESNSF
jgi:acetyltransferase-like isoleucine patch superfamily enzyme